MIDVTAAPLHLSVSTLRLSCEAVRIFRRRLVIPCGDPSSDLRNDTFFRYDTRCEYLHCTQQLLTSLFLLETWSTDRASIKVMSLGQDPDSGYSPPMIELGLEGFVPLF